MCYDFASKNHSSKQFVTGVTQYLQRLPCTLNVVDVQMNRDFQKKDVDLLWTRKRQFSIGIGETTEYVEVKGDFYRSGNLFIETVSNEQKGNPGCMMITEANWLFYSFYHGFTYVIRMLQFREWFLANRSKYREVKTKTTNTAGLTIYTSSGILIPEIDIPYHKRLDTKEEILGNL